MQLLEHRVQRGFRLSGAALIGLAILTISLHPERSPAQQPIAHVQPDALGPGMTIAMEVLAPAKDTGAFGVDGIYLPSAKIVLINPSDSFRVFFGPVVVSWNGRVVQVPVTATSTVTGIIRFLIISGKKRSDTAEFELAQPQSKLSISGGATIGDGSFGRYSFGGSGNTIVTDEIEFLGTDITNKGLYLFSKVDTDASVSGNPHYHPVTILSRGPIHLRNAELSVSADSLNGGPGGGGGGHGFSGTGGAGYTGGGSDSDYVTMNTGSGAFPTDTSGGASSTGVLGGSSSFKAPNVDQGGGGGTGCPYGASGVFSGGNDSSASGGFGGGSAGGETPGVPFGGGGGSFATNGTSGVGVGNNGGRGYGGRFLLPMQGGSGGGAGNHVSELDSTAGSGGGGGGALTLISFDTLSLSSSTVSANGAGGISGLDQVDAGGGGGAGGGILLSARRGVSIDATTISAEGGSEGLGGLGIEQTSKGGVGGKGRMRIDGEIRSGTGNSFISGSQTSGPTLNIPAFKLNGPFANISGLAGDSASLTDSIRIYYRNRHSSWSFLDTVRFKSSGKYRWQAFLPLGHDASLFVTAIAQVRNPARKFANFEPERLLSHLSSGIIPVVATPHLVFEEDTLIFGCYKVGDTCVAANFSIANLGEDSLHVKSITISKADFTVIPTQIDLGFYESKSVVIRYCPIKVGKDSAIITFVSNDHDTIKTAVLIGCGIDKDTRITLKPTILDFGKVHVGKCDTLRFEAHSVGNDPALFSPDALSHSPFTIIRPTTDTLLAQKDSLEVLISFCPGDTGEFHSSFIVTEKRDSIVVNGIGTTTSRILLTEQTINGKTLCLNECDTISARFRTLGNDTVVITTIFGVIFEPNILPIRIPPQTDTQLVLRYCARGKGDASIRIVYRSNADSLVDTTVLHYHGSQPDFVFDPTLNFHSLCFPSQDSLPFSMHIVGVDTIRINSVQLLHGPPFVLAGAHPPMRDSIHLVIHFMPSQSGVYHDTLLLSLSLGVCGDSVLRIPIDGSAAASDVQFSDSTLSFGAVDTGTCKIDSVSVTSTCPTTIQIPQVVFPFTIVSPVGSSVSFSAGETKYLVYRYCPQAIASDSLVQIFNPLPAGPFNLKLIGTGVPAQDSPFVRFRLDSVVATAGTQFQYLISVDSISSGAKINSVQGTLHYDPSLVQPLTMQGVSWKIFNNSEIIPGTYKFSASDTTSLTTGPFANLQMLALYGPRDTCSVFLDSLQIISPAATVINAGFIRVVACTNLSGKILVAGSYALGNPIPNPANDNLSFPVLLGNDGILHIRIYNPSGITAFDRSFELKRGENTMILDVSTLSSGIYYLSADSWGWRDGRTLIIEK